MFRFKMDTRISYTCLALVVVLVMPCTALAQDQTRMEADPPAHGTLFFSPVEITAEGLNFVGREGFLFVPENRAVTDSRTIAIHFYVFPAQEPSDLAPVFYLPGGPGDYYNERRFYEYYGGERARWWTTELRALNRRRPLVIVNQRGNSRAPGILPDLRWRLERAPLHKAETEEEAQSRYHDAVVRDVERWTEQGFDLAGYDILNIAHDLEDLRVALGFETLAFRGGSFGSQWALAYMKQWPEHVDRALLSGIEPLDHAYDHPQHFWHTLERIAALAEQDTALQPMLPKEGLMAAVQTIHARLTAAPQRVTLANPRGGDSLNVVIGAFDFQNLLLNMSPEAWPRFITELYNGDYRYLAALTIDQRRDRDGGLIMATLIDNSLGISAEREAELRAAPARAWLGDLNALYVATRTATPTPVVDDMFRKSAFADIPVLLVHGDLDLSTPFENAEHLTTLFPNATLVRVQHGSHSAVWDLIEHAPEHVDPLFSFMEMNFATTEGQEALRALPHTLSIPRPSFAPLKGQSLYDELMYNEAY